MALGTFALSEGEQDTDPKRVVQLAVDKDGIISDGKCTTFFLSF